MELKSRSILECSNQQEHVQAVEEPLRNLKDASEAGVSYARIIDKLGKSLELHAI